MRSIVVTGATGKQGGAVCRRLLGKGVDVRALVRDPATPAARELAALGATPVRGDLEDPASLRAAFRGADGVFAIPPVAYGAGGTDAGKEGRAGTALAGAAAAAGVRHVVFSGIATISARTGAERGKRAIERALRDRVELVTVLRPVRFMSNYLAVGGPLEGLADGVHRHVFPPDEPVQMIDVDDIGWFAAAAFADPGRYGRRTLELAGDAPTPRQAVEVIRARTGLPLRYHQLDEREAAAIDPEVADVRTRWLAGDRWHADIEALRVLHPGLRTFEEWLAAGGADAITAVAGGTAPGTRDWS